MSDCQLTLDGVATDDHIRGQVAELHQKLHTAELAGDGDAQGDFAAKQLEHVHAVLRDVRGSNQDGFAPCCALHVRFARCEYCSHIPLA